MPTILSLSRFTAQQADAIRAPGETLVVTAGAGSGKTRTLVGRYLALLESGLPLRSIVAITFTNKAAREMRARIRAAIETWLEQTACWAVSACWAKVSDRALPRQRSGDLAEQRARWEKAFAALDGARIGTIHALCDEILRAHPAEAKVDPDFDVLDENQAALLQARAIETALAWAATAPEVVPLFEHMTEYQLRQALPTLMEKRLDATAAFEANPLDRWSDALAAWLRERLEAPDWTTPLDRLTHLQARQSGDKLETARRAVLAHWTDAHTTLVGARSPRPWDTIFDALLALRASISTGGRKGNWDADDLAAAREAMKDLRAYFDAALAPLLNKKKPCSWALDERCAGALPRLRRLFDHTLAEYNRLKQERRALDFDDLEAEALALLAHNDEVRARWQSEVRAVLVDEFQDTNERQRQIVYTLSGFAHHVSRFTSHAPPTSLFVVGDSKQSIYRFRGADVTVFRRVQADVTGAGGRHISLDLTFRAHAPLVALTNTLLAPILGEKDDPQRPYAVPFAPLTAFREKPRPGIHPPYVELHLGLGENAGEGRTAAAFALARRLRRLREEEGVEWKEIALLFRASTGFPSYEDALEQAGIPFVTVAGRGFYDRPEVRDLLNGLTALADPTDDLALAGLLRSPAFALSDTALYLLRWGPRERETGRQGEEETKRQGEGETGRQIGGSDSSPCPPVPPSPCPLWDALNGPLDHLDLSDATRARRAREVIAELNGLVGRTTVGHLLGQFLNIIYYRAALSLAGGHRLRRNVDKLLADAHRSGLVSVGEFLEYVRSLRDVAAREGEAPVEAEGAVQLMTVHKAKGLEFPVVVIADAAHTGRGRTSPVLVSPDLGILLGLRDEKSLPATYRLAHLCEADQEDAESRRLLYVAATRASEKLFVSGHVKAKKDGTPELRGWLAWLGEVTGLAQAQLPSPPSPSVDTPQPLDLDWGGGKLTCVLYPLPGDEETRRQGDIETIPPLPLSLSPTPPNLVTPLTFDALADADSKVRERESDPPPRVWRVVPTAQKPTGPAWVVGNLVHAALRYWRFPDRPGFEEFLHPYALEAGLTDPEEIRRTVATARRLMARFQAHPLYARLDRAERHHEVPYTVEVDGVPRSGIVDLLVHSDDGWTLVEFKTDRLPAGTDPKAHARQKKYDEQVHEYVAAVTPFLGDRPRALLVFLNVGKRVEALTFDTPPECGKIQSLNFGS